MDSGLSHSECLQYWSTQTNDDIVRNRPVDYAAKTDSVVLFMDTLIKRYITRDEPLLELGCNCGVNLYWLQGLGYTNLSGIEINPHAVQQMKESFPSLNAKIVVGDTEREIVNFNSDSANIFSMAALEHIHPDSVGVWKEIARVARKYIIVIEQQGITRELLFHHDYEGIFTKLGFTPIFKIELDKDTVPSVDPNYYGYTAYMFQKNKEDVCQQ